jgi:ADP-dependent NAD(P)H-hydrate dehydratase
MASDEKTVAGVDAAARDEDDAHDVSASPPGTILINPDVLRRMPLPQPDEEGDKESRGRILVVGGSTQMPGAAVLAGVGALRAGAGKLRIATCRTVAPFVAVAVPEARVFALPETQDGGIDAGGARLIAEYAREARALLIGPGMIDEPAIARLVEGLLSRVESLPLSLRPTLILDADALNILTNEPRLLAGLGGRAVLTPHATEMSEMTGEPEEKITSDPASAAKHVADRFGAVVALKGRETLIVAPHIATVYANRAGNVGLATSGSGDVLAGLIAGLAARGADPLTAAVWGVHAHALAGERLARRVGRIGYLARELLDEIPVVLNELCNG